MPRLQSGLGVNRGLIGYWPLGSKGTVKGNVALDLSGRQSNGNLANSPPLAPSPHGQAISFNGSTQYVSLNHAVITAVDGGTQITIAGWFKGTNSQSFVRLQDDTGAAGYVVFPYKGGGAARSIISADGGATGLNLVANIEDGNWHFIAMTWKANTVNGWVQYVDGAVDSQKTSANTNLSIGGTTGPYIGDFGPGTSEFISGSVANVRIYNRALLPFEVLALYRSAAPVPGLLVARRRRPQFIVSGGAYSFAWADIFASSDALTPLMLAIASPSDASVSSDATTGTGRSTSTPSDSAATSDATTGAGTSTGSLPDTIASTDTTIGAGQAAGALPDSSATSDATAGTGRSTATPGDTAASSDTTTGAALATGTLSDSVATSETITGFMLATALLSDSVALSDLFSIIATGAFFFSMSDSLSSSDVTATSFAAASSVIDAVSSSDATSGAPIFNRTLADTIATSDNITSVVPAFIAALSDAIASSDALAFSGIVLMLRPIVAAMRAGPILRIVTAGSIVRTVRA